MTTLSLLLGLILSPLQAGELWPDLPALKAAGGGENDAAIIAGAEQYAFVARVPGARRNADDWHVFLTEGLKVPSEKVALLRDNEATLEKMRKFAAQKASQVKPGGTLWFVFIGHGAPAKDGSDGLLVGADAQQDADSLFARSLSQRELLGLLAKGKQARTLVLVDACFSGRTASGEPLVPGLQPLVLAAAAPAADPRAVIFTAARSDQFAGPLPKAAQARPAFSYLSLGALRGWADADADGKVTAGELVAFAQKALGLAKDRTQTPELSAGSPETVLSLAREAGPDLARIDREGAAKASGAQFQVTSLPQVPTVSVPAALDAEAAGLDFGSLDVEALEKYDETIKFDKTDATPDEKGRRWRSLAKDVPSYAEAAEKRALAWERFVAEKKAAQEAAQKRIPARDADWKKLSRLLALGVIPEGDKKRWSEQFTSAYLESPGIGAEAAAALAPYLPADKNKEVAVKSAAMPMSTPGCETLDGVSVGASKPELIAALGEPSYKSEPNDQNQAWVWGNLGGMQAHFSPSGRVKFLMIPQEQGKPVLTSKGAKLGMSHGEFERIYPGLGEGSKGGERRILMLQKPGCIVTYQFQDGVFGIGKLVAITINE